MSHLPATPNVFWCVYRDTPSPVFDSQVLVPASLYGHDVNLRLIVHVPLGHLIRRRWRASLDAMHQLACERNVELHVLASPPSRMRWLFSDAGRLAAWITKHYGDERLILHCRNAEMTQIALQVRDRLPNVRVIYDCRGAEPAELAQRQSAVLGISQQAADSLPAVRTRRDAEADCVRRADHILCVSQALRKHLESKRPVSAERVTIVPCCLDPDRFLTSRPHRETVREELEIAHRIVVTYCGSLAWYQFPQAALRIVRLLQSRREDVHFLAITTDPQQMQQEIQQAGLPEGRWSVISVSSTEVPRYLVAADLALLLRDDSIVNRVASPVKFAEYMAAGLPVVITPDLGDYSEAVAQYGLGTVLPLQSGDDATADRLAELVASADFRERRASQRCVRFATDNLSWKTHRPAVLGVYRRLYAAGTGPESAPTSARVRESRI